MFIPDEDLVKVMGTMDQIHESDGHEYGYDRRQGKIGAHSGTNDGQVHLGEFVR